MHPLTLLPSYHHVLSPMMQGISINDYSASVKTKDSQRGGRRKKQATSCDVIGEWRRHMSFRIANNFPSCGDINSAMDRFQPIDEEKELEQSPLQRLGSIHTLFCNPRSNSDEVNDSSSVDGVLAFRQCHSFRIEPADSNKERYVIVDADQEEVDVEEDDIIVLLEGKNLALALPEDDHTAPTQQSDDASTDELKKERLSFLDTLCDGVCNLFSSKPRDHKSSDTSVVSLSDMTMPEDGGIFVVRNGATREVDLGEDIAAVDAQLAKETSDRGYPGKLIEEKAKLASNEDKAEEAKTISFDGFAAVIKSMASTLTLREKEKEDKERTEREVRQEEEDVLRIAEARLHADIVRDALEEVGARNESCAAGDGNDALLDEKGRGDDEDGTYFTTKASF